MFINALTVRSVMSPIENHIDRRSTNKYFLLMFIITLTRNNGKKIYLFHTRTETGTLLLQSTMHSKNFSAAIKITIAEKGQKAKQTADDLTADAKLTAEDSKKIVMEEKKEI